MRAFVLAALVAGIGAASAEEAFVTNQLSENLTVVDLATSRPVATIAIGGKPAGVAVTADGRFAYVTSPDAKAVKGLYKVGLEALKKKVESGS